MAAFRNHPRLNPVLIAVLIAGFGRAAWAVEFAGGTGSPNDPYQIATAEQLIGISSDPNLFDKHFLLTADIDLDPSLPGRTIFRQAVMEWTIFRPTSMRRSPVAHDISVSASSEYVSFHGSFDGGGHAIRNCMLVNVSGTRHPGFFGEIAPEAVVRNLRIEDMTVADFGPGPITAGYSAGKYPGLLAAVNQGTVIGCSATGALTIYAGGGLIGQNIGLVIGCRADCDIYGGSVGGLIGRNEPAGRVLLCESGGVMYTDSLAGGLVGTNLGTIQYGTANGFLSAASAGGLVGHNEGIIRECYAAGALTAASGGGMVHTNLGTILNCYCTASLSGTYVDGLVVTNSGTVLSSYGTRVSLPKPAPSRGTRGFVLGSPQDADIAIAALAGKLVESVYYLNPDKAGGSTESPYAGHGVALSPAQMTQKASFVGFDFHGDADDGPAGHWFMPPQGYPVLAWQTEITGLAAVPDVSGLSLEQAVLVLEAAGFEAGGVCFDYARPKMVSSGGTTSPMDTKGQVILTRALSYLPPGSPVDIVVSLGQYQFGQNSGDGSEQRPYRIMTAGQFDAFCAQPSLWGRHFELAADIDLSGYVYPGSSIGDFSGTFNGNGHTIRNLQSGRGLFIKLQPQAVVRDLVVDRADLSRTTGYAGVGILAEVNQGQILRCRATGRIVGCPAESGGLVGLNQGQLADCSFSGGIRPLLQPQWIGGLVGRNTGSILRCCARDVEVSGGDMVGGLVGQSGSETALIEGCYATGVVRGSSSVGGLVGQNGAAPVRRATRSVLLGDPISAAAEPTLGGVVRDSYAACGVTGVQAVGGCIGWAPAPESEQDLCFFLTPNDGGGPDNGLGTPLTTAQMIQQASFVGWDFENTWTICEGVDYPRLKWEMVNCEVGP